MLSNKAKRVYSSNGITVYNIGNVIDKENIKGFNYIEPKYRSRTAQYCLSTSEFVYKQKIFEEVLNPKEYNTYDFSNILGAFKEYCNVNDHDKIYTIAERTIPLTQESTDLKKQGSITCDNVAIVLVLEINTLYGDEIFKHRQDKSIINIRLYPGEMLIYDNKTIEHLREEGTSWKINDNINNDEHYIGFKDMIYLYHVKK